MTTPVEAIRTKLLAATAVTDLVDKRIYPGKAPQGAATPFVVCTVVSNVPQDSFTGGVSSTLKQVRLQVDCYATTYLGAAAVADAVDVVVSALNSPDLSAVREIARDLYDDEAQLHNAQADFSVWL